MKQSQMMKQYIALPLLLLAGTAMSLHVGVSVSAESVPVAMTAASQPTTARLTQIRGRVIVNTGNSYQMAKPNSVLPTGAKVMTVGQSTATLLYQEGCAMEIQSNSQVTVGGQDICRGAPQRQRIYVSYARPETPAAASLPGVQAADMLVSPGPSYLPAAAALLTSVVILADQQGSGRRLPDISPD